jgi:hypothetical protein
MEKLSLTHIQPINCPNLRSLDLHDFQLLDLSLITPLTTLTELSYRESSFVLHSRYGPPERLYKLTKLSALRSLKLHCGVKLHDVLWISNLTQLNCLDLEGGDSYQGNLVSFWN